MLGSKTVLAIDDDPIIVAVIADALSDTGWRVMPAISAKAGLASLQLVRPDIVLLDLVLPDMAGLVLIEQIRRISTVPIVVVSASSAQQDRVISLKLGADDFVEKPFDLYELEARMEAAIRRSARTDQPAADTLSFGNVAMILSRTEATVSGRQVHLTRIEYDLLQMLLLHPREPVKAKDVAREVWGYAEYDEPASHTMSAHLCRLRQKLRQAGASCAIQKRRGTLMIHEISDS